LPTSTTDNPVTQTADVEVNKAVTRSVHVPALEEIGNINRNVPIEITAKNPKQIVLAGFTLSFSSN
jgi:hypothetical protein